MSLLGKQKILKPIQKANDIEEFVCPNCFNPVGYRFLQDFYCKGKSARIMEGFCECGQELDWNDMGYNANQEKVIKMLFPNKYNNNNTTICNCGCNPHNKQQGDG